MFSARATHGFSGFLANNILLYYVIWSKLLFYFDYHILIFINWLSLAHPIYLCSALSMPLSFSVLFFRVSYAAFSYIHSIYLAKLSMIMSCGEGKASMI